MATPDIHGSEQVQALIIGAIASFDVPASRVTTQAAIVELGLDQLDLTELCHLLEEQCGIPVTVDDVARCPTIADLVALVNERGR
jgi:acyl carrier protein